jgi:hypothetical protein
VSELDEELIAAAKAAKRAEAAYQRHLKRVRELLPQVRAQDVKKYGPAVLEDMIGKVYDRGTISRYTAEAVGTSKKAREPADAAS